MVPKETSIETSEDTRARPKTRTFVTDTLARITMPVCLHRHAAMRAFTACSAAGLACSAGLHLWAERPRVTGEIG